MWGAVHFVSSEAVGEHCHFEEGIRELGAGSGWDDDDDDDDGRLLVVRLTRNNLPG